MRDIHVGHRVLEEGGAPVIDMSVDDSDQESPVRLTGNRFEALSDTAADPDVARPRRRLVLISQNPEPSASANELESDTDRFDGVSEVDVEGAIQGSVPNVLIPAPPRIFGLHHAFASLDTVNLVEMFSSRARVMQSVLWVL